MRILRCALAAILAATMLASHANAPPDEARYQALIDELRCLVCQNQTIAESNAPLAADLRQQVRRQMDEGRTDREIIDYVTARYGDFVLYRPPFKARTWLLWVGPFALLLTVVALAALFIRRSRAAPRPPAPADPGAVKALLDAEAQRKPDMERKP
jgi:cytochrome c-type biogenesis protein CcmH